VTDGFAAGDCDSPAKALGILTQAGGERIESWSFHRKEVLLDDGCPNGANVGIPAQDRDEVGVAVPRVINLSNKPIQPKADSRGGVFHALRVFQYAEALVRILHGLLRRFVGQSRTEREVKPTDADPRQAQDGIDLTFRWVAK
jgi:hypothetical protein